MGVSKKVPNLDYVLLIGQIDEKSLYRLMSENALLKRFMDKVRLEIRCTESYTYHKFPIRLLRNNLHDVLRDVSLETRCQT